MNPRCHKKQNFFFLFLFYSFSLLCFLFSSFLFLEGAYTVVFFFYFLFFYLLGHLSGMQELLLVLYSGLTPDRLKGYRMPIIEFRSPTFKASTLYPILFLSVLKFLLSQFKTRYLQRLPKTRHSEVWTLKCLRCIHYFYLHEMLIAKFRHFYGNNRFHPSPLTKS